MAYGEEDVCRRNQGNVILRRPLDNQGIWQTRCTIGQGVKGPRLVGPSANWYQLGSGLCAFQNFVPGKRSMELVLSEPNDLLQGEYIADAAHYVFSLEGMMFQRKYYRAHNYDDLANKVDANILQWWAHILLATNQLDTPERTNFAFAHQRTVFPTGSATLIDYYWRRGCGQSHTGTGLANLGERIAIRQAPFNGKLFADFFIGELRADVGRLLVSYRTMGYTGIARLIKRGSRGLFHWIRLDNGGYISLLENDIGVDEPRYVAIRHSKGSNLVQFPEGNVGRFSREGRATLDIASGHITALDSTYGSFSTTFDPKTIALHVTATPNGVTIQGRWA